MKLIFMILDKALLRPGRFDRQIDDEVKAVIQSSYARVSNLLEEKRPTLDALAAKLEEEEVLSGGEVESIVKNP